MKNLFRSIRIIFLMVMMSMITACGGGDSPPTDTTNTDTTDPTDTTTSAAISGFDFALSKGDFWEYGWDYGSKYTAINSRSYSAKSNFRITLGDPVTVDAVTFYEMLISGNTKESEYGDLTPNGKYLAVSNNKIITLAADGTTQKVIFDAQAGSWPGSGFFTFFLFDNLFKPTDSTISNDYINQTAHQISDSASSSQCEYFSGVGTICGGDYDENMDEREYYMPGVGPVGFYGYFQMADWSAPDGGWSWSSTTNIGLTASSLWNDTVDYVLEVEPNNQIADATAITLPAKIKGDDASEAYLGGTTAVTVAVTSVSEVEPNDSPFAPQTVDIPSTITGVIFEGSTNTSVAVSAVPGGTEYTATFEDWYEVTLGTGKTLNAALNFPGTFADLDMYLFSLENASSVITHANSIDDNIGTATYIEQMSQYLAAGTYYVAVDAYSTPRSTDYTLDITTLDSLVNIGDWFSFSIASQAQVSIMVTGGPSFVLTDGAGVGTLASGGAAGTSITLDAGTYIIGVSEGGAYTLDVTSP